MAGKKKTVLFFTGGEKDKDGVMHDWSALAWEKFFEKVHGGSPSENSGTYYGRKYFAVPQTSASGEKYFKITVDRYKVDWPDVVTQDHEDPLSVKEYACVFPVKNYQYIAVVKSSAGPRAGAVESLINSILETALTEGDFILQPVMRHNSIERLNNAVGVGKIYVRYEPNSSEEKISGSIVDSAAEGALDIDGLNSADFSIDYTVGLKRPKAVGPAQDSLDKELRKLVGEISPDGKGPIKKLVANVLQPQDDGKLKSEPIDFIKDRITVRGEFGSREDAILSKEDIEQGVSKAIGEFKETMRKA